MSENTVARKLLIKPGYTILLVKPPDGYIKLLGKLPDDATLLSRPSEKVDLIQVFCLFAKRLRNSASSQKAVAYTQVILWVTYLKGTSKLKTDINRDTIRSYAHSLGLEGVSILSIDEDWSALRLKVI
jgi:hypothetical protein